MSPLKVHVILGSTRKNRFSEKPGLYILGELNKREGVNAELVDLRDWPLPFYDEAGSPNSLKGNFANGLGNKWNEKVAEADGYVVISPEYNHGYTGVLKNAFDWVYAERWAKKPMGFVSYGSTLGARSVGQIRQVAIECQLVPIRNAVHISSDVLRTVLAIEGPIPQEAWKPLREPIDRVSALFDELLWYVSALREARVKKD